MTREESKAIEKARRMLRSKGWERHLREMLCELKVECLVDAAKIGGVDAMLYDVGNEPGATPYSVAAKRKRRKLVAKLWNESKRFNVPR